MQHVEASSVLDGEECGICYQDYGPDRRPRPLTSCRHTVCEQCLDHLVGKGVDVTCPFCRARSTLPSDEEEGAEKGLSATKWFKKLCRKSRNRSRRQGAVANEEFKDMAMMCTFIM
ncbi:E3 ubiquitin-protein ligase RNF182 [Bombina bombina]|uniref:E3 ubiquitin-protein ligase RNF182 n=1 Tax=Bombina bombina TaxID=8345 RepID=UPI00235AD482|nr:E3 ubiquitin-protein ligase RNF182 [Bombina bombina]